MVDVKEVDGEWYVYLNGGCIVIEIKFFDWVKEVESWGVGEILFISMDYDGIKVGFVNEVIVKVVELV